MKLGIIHLLIVVGLLHINASCQTNSATSTSKKAALAAKTTQVFNHSENEYGAGVVISAGEITLNDSIYAWDGTELIELFITEISYKDKKVTSLGKTEGDYEAYVTFKALSNGKKFNHGFQLTHTSAGIPSGATSNSGTGTASSSSSAGLNGSSDLDGKSWPCEVAYQGALWYAKGLSYMNCEEPYLQLTFVAKNAPDQRQLLISICDFNGNLGVIPNENYSVTLSGAATGASGEEPDLISDKGVGKKKSNFVIEVTDFKQISSTKALISIKFSGTLDKGLMIDYTRTFKNGEMNNIEVTVFNEKH